MIRVVDLFAGGGGTTEGARQAGAKVLWAANHSRLAVETHAANHPGTVHECQDLLQADFHQVPDHDLLLASPACQGHAPASQPNRIRRHDDDRATAWAVVTAAEVKRPPYLVVENVPWFQKWILWDAWIAALKALGYQLQVEILNAADFGVPQDRPRLFVLGQLPGARAVALPRGDGRARVGAESFVDWAAGTWKRIADTKPGVQKRIEDARSRGLGARFVTHYVTGHRGRELSRPVGVITTKNQWGVVDGDRVRLFTADEYRAAMGFPEGYRLPASKTALVKMVGNAVPPPMAKAIVQAVAS